MNNIYYYTNTLPTSCLDCDLLDWEDCPVTFERTFCCRLDGNVIYRLDTRRDTCKLRELPKEDLYTADGTLVKFLR